MAIQLAMKMHPAGTTQQRDGAPEFISDPYISLHGHAGAFPRLSAGPIQHIDRKLAGISVIANHEVDHRVLICAPLTPRRRASGTARTSCKNIAGCPGLLSEISLSTYFSIFEDTVVQ